MKTVQASTSVLLKMAGLSPEVFDLIGKPFEIEFGLSDDDRDHVPAFACRIVATIGSVMIVEEEGVQAVVILPSTQLHLKPGQLTVPYIYFEMDDPAWRAKVLNPQAEISRLKAGLPLSRLHAETAFEPKIAFCLL